MIGLPSIQTTAIIAVIVGIAAFGAGWTTNGWRLNSKYQEEKQMQLEANQATFNRLLSERDTLAGKLSASNDSHIKELEIARNETNALRNKLDSGSIGLRINAKCPNTGLNATSTSGAGLDTGASAELDSTARLTYFALRDGINQTVARLNACQDELKLRTAKSSLE